MRRYTTPLLLTGMALGLALFYLSPAPLAIRLLGALLFGALALAHPSLGLLFVPLSAPLYLIPAAITGLRASETLLPLHEVALLLTAAAAAGRWLWRLGVRLRGRDAGPLAPGAALPLARSYGPAALFLLAGVWGVAVALPDHRAEALREFRWLIVEPLVFFGLARSFLSGDGRRAAGYCRHLTWALIAGGVFVALLGLLQFAGLDLVPLLGQKRAFSENIVATGGVQRVASVYGHPNNLGLFLGRVWPLAAALALIRIEKREPRAESREPAGGEFTAGSWLSILCALICLGGLAVSFSRGAWLGAAAAGLTLGLGAAAMRRGGEGPRRALALAPWLLLGLLGVAGVAALALALRGGLSGGSADTRALLWREALAYIQQRPLGIGLDQFLYYHHPQYGRSLIDPALIGTSEEWAAHPHNLLLDIWLRLGPPGLAAFGWLLARFFRQALAGLRDASADPAGAALCLGALAAIVAALLHGMVDQLYFVPDLAIAFWLLLALVDRP